MATEEQFNAKMKEVEDALTTEIEEIAAELKKVGVPDASLERLTALQGRVSGIISTLLAAVLKGGENNKNYQVIHWIYSGS